jgi:hypothetical protein
MNVLIDERHSAISMITLDAVRELELPQETTFHHLWERATRRSRLKQLEALSDELGSSYRTDQVVGEVDEVVGAECDSKRCNANAVVRRPVTYRQKRSTVGAVR